MTDTLTVLTEAQIDDAMGPVRMAFQGHRSPLTTFPRPSINSPPMPHVGASQMIRSGTGVIRGTPLMLKRNLKWMVTVLDYALTEWLAGSESLSTEPTDAYVAYSAMRMAADCISSKDLHD